MATRFEQTDQEQTWGIVEVMGHSSYAGILREVEFCGAKFLEVTVPAQENLSVEFTMRVSPSAIFRMCETTEEWARKHDSSVPDQYRIRPVAIRQPTGGHLPHFAPAEDDAGDELTCNICGSEITMSSAALYGGSCADCNAESRDS
jgi:hypothetical protein